VNQKPKRLKYLEVILKQLIKPYKTADWSSIQSQNIRASCSNPEAFDEVDFFLETVANQKNKRFKYLALILKPLMKRRITASGSGFQSI